MKKINTFTFLSLDGFYAGPHGEIDWFKAITPDAEYQEFTHAGAQQAGGLMFGHTTYEMMKSYWPTEAAIKTDPSMADVLNNTWKLVFSKSMSDAADEGNWKNIKVYNEIDADEIMQMKAWDGKDITILGSGTIVQQLANMDLIDTYHLMIVPIILGAGKHLFQGVKQTELKLLNSRSFKNGVVSLQYEPVR